MSVSTIIWFRSDLRLRDNPALGAAISKGETILPVFIFSQEEEGEWPFGGASKVWLDQSLRSLNSFLERKGSRLIIRHGSAQDVLGALIDECGAEAVYWNRRYEPHAIERDTQVKSFLKEKGVEAKSFNASLLFEPWEIKTQQGAPYKVFTPFWKNCSSINDIPTPCELPNTVRPPESWPQSLSIDELKLRPSIGWDAGILAAWEPGEDGARKQLKRFVERSVAAYDETRNLPAIEGTSRLSPYLHFGEISPRQIWHEVQSALDNMESSEEKKSTWSYLREIGWREFAYHLLFHFPRTTSKPLREEFSRFPWKDDDESLNAWQKGMTGYPIVDAGMRELWTTGWMHNRVRMIVASFLVKDLMIPWQEGARWFWDTLVDADLASNTLGWQWTAGCGADAAPYFRIFNPVSQGEKFDADGEYVKRWVPELSKMPAKWIHKPWEAPESVLKQSVVALGDTYPNPIIDHKLARQAALDAYQDIKNK